MSLRLPFLIGFLLPTVFLSLLGQDVYISRLDPGRPQMSQDELYRIELFNESEREIDLGGYLIVTRYKVLRLPSGSYVAPFSSLKIGYSSDPQHVDLTIQSLNTRKSREVTTEEEGDFVALITPENEWIDGFYYSPHSRVNFLPTYDRISLDGGDILTISLPDETDYRWAHLPGRADPAMAMVHINGQWKPNSRTRNLLQATQYSRLGTKYVDGIVTINWVTFFERDCYRHLVERSTDGQNYRQIAQVSGPVNSEGEYQYVIYDPEIEKGKVYYYRVSSVDKFGNELVSSPSRLRAEEPSGEFTFDIIRAEGLVQRSFDVRFSSRSQQQVRVALVDEQMREISQLYYGTVEAQRQNLINYRQELSAGKYYLIVATENRRYFRPIVIQ